jgi:inorganic triphosphatase YgiF
MMQHHVLEVGLDEGNLVVNGIDELITEGEMI